MNIKFPKKRRFSKKQFRRKLLPKSWNRLFLVRRLVLRRRRRYKRRWRKIFLRKLKKKKFIDKLKPKKKIYKVYYKFFRKKTLINTKELVCYYIQGRRQSLTHIKNPKVVAGPLFRVDWRTDHLPDKLRVSGFSTKNGPINKYLVKRKKLWKRYLKRWRPATKRRKWRWVRRKLRKRRRLKKINFFKKTPKNLFYISTQLGDSQTNFRSVLKKKKIKPTPRPPKNVNYTRNIITKSKSLKSWIGKKQQTRNKSIYRSVENSIRHLIYENWNFWEKFHPEKEHPRHLLDDRLEIFVENKKQMRWDHIPTKLYKRDSVFDLSKKKKPQLFVLSKKKKINIEQVGRTNLRNVSLTDKLRKAALKLFKLVERGERGARIGTSALLTYLRFYIYYDQMNYMPNERSSKRSIHNRKLRSSWKRSTKRFKDKIRFLKNLMPKVVQCLGAQTTIRHLKSTKLFIQKANTSVKQHKGWKGWKAQSILKKKKLINKKRFLKLVYRKKRFLSFIKRILKRYRKVQLKKIKKFKRFRFSIFKEFSELDEIWYEEERSDMAEGFYDTLMIGRLKSNKRLRRMVFFKKFKKPRLRQNQRVKQISYKIPMYNNRIKTRFQFGLKKKNLNIRLYTRNYWFKFLFKKKFKSNYEYKMLLEKKLIPKFKVKIKFKNFRFRNRIFYKKKKRNTLCGVRIRSKITNNSTSKVSGSAGYSTTTKSHAFGDTGLGLLPDTEAMYTTNLKKEVNMEHTHLEMVKPPRDNNIIKFLEEKSSKIVKWPRNKFKIFKRRFRKRITLRSFLSKKKKYNFIKIFKITNRKIFKLSKRPLVVKKKTKKVTKRVKFLKKIFFKKKKNKKFIFYKDKPKLIKKLKNIHKPITLYSTRNFVGSTVNNKSYIKIIKEVLKNKVSTAIKKKKQNWLSPKIRATGLQVRKNAIKGGFRNLNLKIVGKLGFRAALRGFSASIFHIINSLPLRIRRFFRKAKYVFTMMLLATYHDVGIWSSYLNKLFYRTKFYRQRRLFYTLRSLLPRTAQICGQHSAILGMYMSFKGKIASRGGQRSKTLRTSTGWYTSANFGIQYRYRFKQIWSKSGAIGLKTIITCGNMHINRD